MITISKKIFIILFVKIIFILFTQCAQVATGAAAKVVTVSKEERTIGEFVDDTLLKAMIKNSYLDQSENIFFNVDVEVSQGRVLLTGTLENIDLKIEATRLAWSASGVKTVINEIQISDSDSIMNYADDLVISTKVKGKLVLDENINSLNYNVETVNKVVYIIGIARNIEEREKVIEVSENVFGVEEVIDYITIQSNDT